MKIYEIKNNKIIFYPYRHDFNALGIILCLCLYMIFFPIIISIKNNEQNLSNIYIILATILPLAILLLFLYISKKTQIIIDAEENKIFKKNLLGEKFLTSLDNIREIRLIETVSFVNSYNYALIYKDNKFGEGIRITPQLRKNSKALKNFRETILNDIIDSLRVNTIDNLDCSNNKTIHSFKEERPNYYVYRAKNLGLLLAAIVFFSLFIFRIALEAYSEIFTYIALGLSLLTFFSLRQKTCINLNDSKVEYFYNFGMSKREIAFSDIKDIYLERKIDNNSRTSSIIILYKRDDAESLKRHALYTSNKEIEVAQFANDIEILLNREIRI